MKNFAWGLIPALAVSGCVLTRPTDPYGGMRGYWTGQVDTAVGARGQDSPPLATPDGPLTLGEAIRIAMVNNPQIAAQRSDVEAAAAQKDFAVGEAIPHLSLEAGYSHFLDPQRLVPPSRNGQVGTFGRDIASGDLVVRLPLFTGGRITSSIRAAELLTLAAQHRLSRSREELAFNVTSLYFGVVSQGRVIESLRFSQEVLERHQVRVEHQIQAEKAAKVDLLRTQVRLANLDQQVVAEQNVRAVQYEALASLLGLSSDHAALEVVGDLEAVPLVMTKPSLAIHQALAQRTDFLAAQAALEAQAKAVDAARAARWPSISGQASYGGRWAFDPSQQPGTDRSEDLGSIGVVGEIPLFAGGQIEAQIHRERARLSAARQRLRALALQIHLDVKTALLNTQSAYEQVQATRTAIEQATESLRIEREKYDLGKGAITDVLDAQSALLFTQTSYYRALSGYNVALAQYRLAIGAPLK